VGFRDGFSHTAFTQSLGYLPWWAADVPRGKGQIIFLG